MTRDAIILIAAASAVFLAVLIYALRPGKGHHKAPRHDVGWDERLADTGERQPWTADDMPFLPAPPTVGAVATGWLPRTPVPPPLERDPWTGPHAVPDIPGMYDHGCQICGREGHAAAGHDAVMSIMDPPAATAPWQPSRALPAYVREALHHDTVAEAVDAPSMITAAYVDPDDDEDSDEDAMKIVITRMHLARHQGSHFPACDPRLLLPLQALTMDPGLVRCGNCKRTTLYATAVRVTEQIAVLGQVEP